MQADDVMFATVLDNGSFQEYLNLLRLSLLLTTKNFVHIGPRISFYQYKIVVLDIIALY